jgi:hypothetical protein
VAKSTSRVEIEGVNQGLPELFVRSGRGALKVGMRRRGLEESRRGVEMVQGGGMMRETMMAIGARKRRRRTMMITSCARQRGRLYMISLCHKPNGKSSSGGEDVQNPVASLFHHPCYRWQELLSWRERTWHHIALN